MIHAGHAGDVHTRSPPASAGGFYGRDTLFGFRRGLYNSSFHITHGEPS